MKSLAFEFSTRRASLALFDGSRLIDEESWDEPQARHLHWHLALQRLLKRTGLELAGIGAFAVGRGPGAFSGIRIAVTAAQVLALPENKAVYAASSGEALAARMFVEHAVSSVAVVGDARRGAFWFGVFDREGDFARARGAWTLTPSAQIGERLRGVELVVTPEWERIGAALETANVPVEKASLFSRAREVAELVLRRLERGVPGEPVSRSICTHLFNRTYGTYETYVLPKRLASACYT